MIKQVGSSWGKWPLEIVLVSYRNQSVIRGLALQARIFVVRVKDWLNLNSLKRLIFDY